MATLKKTLLECPFCGSGTGFYVRSRVSGLTSVHYEFNGEPGDNSHMWDYINMKDQKTAFCSECQKKIGVVE